MLPLLQLKKKDKNKLKPNKREQELKQKDKLLKKLRMLD